MRAMGGGSSTPEGKSKTAQKPAEPPVTVHRMTQEEFQEMERQADERYRNRPRPIDANGNVINDEAPVCRLPPQPWPPSTVEVTYANPQDDPRNVDNARGPAAAEPQVTVHRMTPEEFQEMERQADERHRNRPRPIDANGNAINDAAPVCRLPPQKWPPGTAVATYANPQDDPRNANNARGPASTEPQVTVHRMTAEEFKEMERQADERYRNRPRPIDANGNVINDEAPVCRLPPQQRPLGIAKATYANPPQH